MLTLHLTLYIDQNVMDRDSIKKLKISNCIYSHIVCYVNLTV